MVANIEPNNRLNVNTARLENLVRLTKTTLSFLLHQVDEGTLKHFTNADQITEFEKQIESVILNKLKSKLNI